MTRGESLPQFLRTTGGSGDDGREKFMVQEWGGANGNGEGGEPLDRAGARDRRDGQRRPGGRPPRRRDAATSFDVSTDLDVLARGDGVPLVCAGFKSIRRPRD
jgi:hypothetical protein